LKEAVDGRYRFGLLHVSADSYARQWTLYGGTIVYRYVASPRAVGPDYCRKFGLFFLHSCHHKRDSLKTGAPCGLAVKKSAGGRTIGSATMPYTGFLILCFLILHLFNFRFIEQTPQIIFQAVYVTLSDVFFKVIYIAAIVIVVLHVRHGFWSLFQTLGANNIKYMPMIQAIGIAFALLALAGFGFIPIYIGMIA
jgi:succinate dehydrogenase / fumarate reductase cytochrome b subunit